ncbi:DNA repair protein RecO [Dehalogenimonas sp. THU2]|uniref:DNA repair protein RecO n=1 Tax=Dehalogenimonas sp. THU2 TaxID=3151121 RepID=UPI003218B27F
MTASHELKTPAVVIKRARLKEADRVITLFTRELGKISAIARGVRKAKSKLAGHLETLTYTDVTLARGKNMDIIIGSQTLNAHLDIRNSLERTSYALYFTELVYHFAPEGQPNLPLFDLLTETLGNLGQTANLELLSRFFELNHLTNLGYQPSLYRCLNCGSDLQPVTNYFSALAGGTLCPDCAAAAPIAYPISSSGLKVMRFLMENGYDSAMRLKYRPALNQEIRRITQSYLRFLLEHEIKSAVWLDELKMTLLCE